MNIPKDTRSDSEVLRQTLTLTFHVNGVDNEYVVPVLRRPVAREWREQYLKHTQEVADAMGVQMDERSPDLSKAMGRALLKGLLEFPDALPELVASYVSEATLTKNFMADGMSEDAAQRAAAKKAIPKAVIDNAYDQEIEKAFLAIWGVAFRPSLSSLGMAIETGQAMKSPSQKSNAVN